MTTFQAIVYSIIHGFSEFLPISSNGHHILAAYLLNWPQPAGVFLGVLALGSLLALLIYFIHDWASIISCFLQVILFRKRPMTLDERLPIFLFFTSLPTAVSWYYLHEKILSFDWTPLWVAGSLALFGIPIWFADSMSRRNRGMFDWNIGDALIVGITQMAVLIPGCGRIAAALPGALSRNYNREAAVKYVLYASAPLLAASVFVHFKDLDWRAPIPMDEMSWLSFWVSLVVTTLVSLLAIGGLMKHVQRAGFGQYVVYRWLLAATVSVIFFLRNQ